MKKAACLFAVLILAGVMAGGVFAVSSSMDDALTYEGVYIDLLEQEKIDAELEARRNAPPSDSSGLYIVRYNADSGYVDGITIIGDGVTKRQLGFLYGGIELELQFVNDVLVGCRKTYAQELTDRLEVGLDQERAELSSFWLLKDNYSWITDEDYLELVLADYTEQVQAYQRAHPGARISSVANS